MKVWIVFGSIAAAVAMFFFWGWLASGGEGNNSGTIALVSGFVSIFFYALGGKYRN